jgi:hypothetical protein
MPQNYDTNPDLKIDATFVVGVEAADAINTVIQLIDRENRSLLDESAALGWYLSDDALGMVPASTAPTGGAAIGTDGALIESVDNLSGKVISEIDGDIDITLTDTGTPTFHVVLVMPDGKLFISPAITFV